MSRLRWGLLSTARINAHLLAPDPSRFVAVASRSQARAAAYAAEHGIARAHGSYEALLADPEVDAVYVSLPNGLHAEWSQRALEAGRHVLCEKPFGRDPEVVAAAFDAAEREGLVLAEALMWRHHPQVACARQLIREGAIGDVRLLRAAHTAFLADRDDPRMDPALDGGALMDVGCYAVSGLRAFAGEPLAVTASRVCENGVDVRLVATLRFPGDVLATLDCAFDTVYRKALEIVGSDGVLTLNDPWIGDDAPAVELRRAGGEVERHELAQPVTSYALELDDFEAAVRGERPPLLGRADAIGQARALALLHAAAGG